MLNAGTFLRPLAAGVLLAYLLKDFSFARLKTGIKNYFSGGWALFSLPDSW